MGGGRRRWGTLKEELYLAISTDFLRRLALLPATLVHPATQQCHPKSSSKPLPSPTSHLHQLPPSLPPTILPSLHPSPLPTLSTSPPSLPYSLQSAAYSLAPVGGAAPGGPSSVVPSPVSSDSSYQLIVIQMPCIIHSGRFIMLQYNNKN